jgi:beta-lactamase regulating signal transducer with metallopeptidase domain
MPHLDPASILSVLWRASWQAGVLCLLVLALRWTLRDRLPAAWRCRLWGLVFLRLLLPAVPSSPLSLFNLVPADPLPAARWPTLTVVVQSRAVAPMPPATEGEPAQPAPRPSRWPDVLLATWLGGAGVLLGMTAAAHVRFARRVVRSTHPVPADATAQWHALGGRRPLVVTDAVSSPALFGVIGGRLLLPRDLSGRLSTDELALVFRHELAHVRRHDLPIGWLAVLVRCVYWFHPLAWVAVGGRRADAESACDDAVVAGTGDRLAYGRVLLAVAGGRSVPAIGMADARTDLRRRLARVATGRRPGWWSTAVAAGLTVAVGCATLTGGPPRSADVTRTYQPFLPQSSGTDTDGFAKGPPLVSGRPQTRAELADLIRRTVTPDVWRRPGTGIAFDGRDMRVTAPPDTQAGVAELLADLAGEQVSVVTRILTVRPEAVRAAGIPVPAAGAATPLSDEQAGALIRLAESDRDATQLTAPRLTLFSGQVAHLIVKTDQAYVSDVTPVFAPGASLLDPTVSTAVASGVDEAVRATVTADRQAVDLTARIELRRLTSMESVDIACTRGGQTIHGTVQLPRTHVVRADPALRVISGGTILLRGFESDIGAGGPATRPAGETGRVALVLIRPTVLLRTAQPVRTFPLLPQPPAAAAPRPSATSTATRKGGT